MKSQQIFAGRPLALLVHAGYVYNPTQDFTFPHSCFWPQHASTFWRMSFGVTALSLKNFLREHLCTASRLFNVFWLQEALTAPYHDKKKLEHISAKNVSKKVTLCSCNIRK